MAKANRSSVSIAPDHNKATLSKGQKAFNALIEQIEKRRERLSAWEAAMPAFLRKYMNQYVPLEQASIDLRIQLVHRMDQAYDEKGLSKSDRSTMAELISELAGALATRTDNPELKRIYERYSESGSNKEAVAKPDDTKSVPEAEPRDDVDLNSPEAAMQRAHEQMEQHEAQEAAAREAREAHRAQRKKTLKQRAAESRQKAEQAETSVSIREVYRKLASALHPDRELDPQERDRKTALMQRVNQAYDKKSLLQLLELQLELEHIDQTAIDNIGEERLKHYNQILTEQVAELDREIARVEAEFKDRFGIQTSADVSPGTIMRILSADIVSLQQSLHALQHELRVFDDVKQLKDWLKMVKQSLATTRFDS
jgi:hypothetical protein